MPSLSRRRFTHLAAALATSHLAAAPLARAQAWAEAALDRSPRHREYLHIKTAEGRILNTYVVYPEVAGKAPAILLIHEIFGLSAWARLMADELAAQGYIVLAPDLLSGTGPGASGPLPGQAGVAPSGNTELPTGAQPQGGMPNQPGGGTDAYPSVEAVVKAVSALPPAQVLLDLDAVADFAQHRVPSANGKLAVAGFCWGGGKTFAFATHRAGLAASFVFYGPPPPTPDMVSISAPVYGFYAGNDARISATVPDTVTAMKAAGKPFDAVIYPGAGHGFMRAGQAPDATDDNKKAWHDGFARLTRLLAPLK